MNNSGIILHSYRRCPFAIRVRMVLEEKNLPYQVIEENLSALSERLLALHPEGRVPLLIHGDQVIYESSVITEYLEEAFPTPALLPRAPELRAQVRLWTYWCNEIFKPDLDAFKYEYSKMPAPEKTELLKRMNRHLEKMEAPLKSGPFVMGSELTLADLHLFPFYRQLTRVQPGFPELALYPKLAEWLEKISLRTSFARTMKPGPT